MKIIEPSVEILSNVDSERIYRSIEEAGRTAYKTEDKMTPDSSIAFMRMLIRRGHESVFEHESIKVRIICNRGVTHELVRHRIGIAFTQESSRYVNYNKRGVSFIDPLFFREGCVLRDLWQQAVEASEKYYNALIEEGATPEEARDVLPNANKTEIVVTANIREWRHIMVLRTARAAHPQMRQVMRMLLRLFREYLPELFNDVGTLTDD